MAHSGYILTGNGVSLVINGKSYGVEDTHPSYDKIVEAAQQKNWNDIPALIDGLKGNVVKKDARAQELELRQGVLYYKNRELPEGAQQATLNLLNHNYDVRPMLNFLDRLFQNPSFRAVEQLYRWISANGMAIDEDGYFFAYKRVRSDFKSFHDGETNNKGGTYVEMPRNMVNDRAEETCSYGLHFCSYPYLSQFNGGSGTIILLRIDPADVVSIPTDYNNAKGRACKYFVVDTIGSEGLTSDEVDVAEPADILKDVAVVNVADMKVEEEMKIAYNLGYRDGRGKQKKLRSANATISANPRAMDFYNEGYVDGRARNPRRFGE